MNIKHAIQCMIIACALGVGVTHTIHAAPIHKAVIHRDIKEIQRLLDSGVDINTPNSDEETPLILASATEGMPLSIVTYLLEAGADVNIRNVYGNTALTSAVLSKNNAIAITLLKHGANTNTLDRVGNSPLIYATLRDNADIVPILLHYGAHALSMNNLGKTALDIARTWERHTIAHYIERHIHQSQRGQKTALPI